MRNRRALSSVVGMVFAIIAITSTVAYVSYSMNILNNFGQTVLQKNQQTLDTGKEKFQISNVQVSNGKLNITAANTGTLPINFTKIWVQNTSATDWIKSYVPGNSFVAPGGTLIKIGQNLPLSINPSNSYNVKLVTSRGNAQQFTLNSASSAPINIQFYAIPNTVSDGFHTQLLLIVTNNGSSTLTNITPTALPNPPIRTGIASCIAGAVNPTSINSLPPGNSAVFVWDVVVAAGNDGDTCTYTLSPPIQNGYPGQSVSAKITSTTVKFTSTNLAASTGVLTINYTSFRFTQSSGQYAGVWDPGWNFTASTNTAFKINMTNNNQTTDFYVSSFTQIYYSRTGASNAGPIYIVGSVTPGSPYTMTAYCGGNSDWCLKIPAGQTTTLYFGSYGKNNRLGTVAGNLGSADTYTTNLMLYGRFGVSGTAATRYAQSLPYTAWLGS